MIQIIIHIIIFHLDILHFIKIIVLLGFNLSVIRVLIYGQLMFMTQKEITFGALAGIRPIVCIPLTSCNITEGGLNGADFHIEPNT